MEYINNYTYEKHLKAKEIKEKTEENVACEEAQVVKEQGEELKAVSEQELPVNSDKELVKKRFLSRIRSFFTAPFKFMMDQK